MPSPFVGGSDDDVSGDAAQIAIWMLYGFLAVIPYLAYCHFGLDGRGRLQIQLLGRGLVGAALVYVGFALYHHSFSGNSSDGDSFCFTQSCLEMEIAGLFLYGPFYPLAMRSLHGQQRGQRKHELRQRKSAPTAMACYCLAIGWILHPMWDIFLHSPGKAAAHIAPEWYVWFCIAFDIAVAAYLVWLARRGRSAADRQR